MHSGSWSISFRTLVTMNDRHFTEYTRYGGLLGWLSTGILFSIDISYHHDNKDIKYYGITWSISSNEWMQALPKSFYILEKLMQSGLPALHNHLVSYPLHVCSDIFRRLKTFRHPLMLPHGWSPSSYPTTVFPLPCVYGEHLFSLTTLFSHLFYYHSLFLSYYLFSFSHLLSSLLSLSCYPSLVSSPLLLSHLFLLISDRDMILFMGFKYVYTVAMAIFTLYEREMLSMGFDDILSFLQFSMKEIGHEPDVEEVTIIIIIMRRRDAWHEKVLRVCSRINDRVQTNVDRFDRQYEASKEERRAL